MKRYGLQGRIDLMKTIGSLPNYAQTPINLGV